MGHEGAADKGMRMPTIGWQMPTIGWHLLGAKDVISRS
jgi:hypothetical protein